MQRFRTMGIYTFWQMQQTWPIVTALEIPSKKYMSRADSH